MFHLIGVAHRVQSKTEHSDDSEDQKVYRECLSDAIRRIQPALVAEEFSEYALTEARKNGESEHLSVTKAIADSLVVPHRYCDPEPKERKRIGYVEAGQLFMRLVSTGHDDCVPYAIEVLKYWPLREQFWLDQLHDVSDQSVIFVCGDAHIESFQRLLARSHVGSQVIIRRIGVNQSDDAFWGRVQACIDIHPELIEYTDPSD